MKVKVRGGTVNHGDAPLCSSCRYALIVKGARLGDEIVRCNVLGPQVRLRFPVTSCSAYDNRAQPTLWQMEEIAWVLRSSPRGKKVGFVEARKLGDDERHVLED
jgi:hypothetical protein